MKMIMEILQFVFRGFWTFLGSLLLISAIINGFANVLKSIAMMIHGVPPQELPKTKTSDVIDDTNKQSSYL